MSQETSIRVTSKRIMYELVDRGRFGNYPLNWTSVEDVIASGFQGEVSIRSTVVSNPVKLYHVPVSELAARVAALDPKYTKAPLRFSEAPPEHLRTIQGEWDGTRLTYTFDANPMRIALLNDCRHATGIMARSLLRTYLDPADVDWLDELLTDFPDHTVEFSGFNAPVGILQTRMYVWECRYY